MFTGFAIGTIGVVGVAVAGSLTALPALLALLGPWADRGRLPFLGKARTRAERSRVWAALVERVVRKPLAWGAIAVAGLGLLAVPALGMRIGSPAINLPSSLPVVRTLTMIQRDFPGGPAPAQVVAWGPGVRSKAMAEALSNLSIAARPGSDCWAVSAVPVGAYRVLVTVPLAGAWRCPLVQRAVAASRPDPARHVREGERRAVRRHRRYLTAMTTARAALGRTPGLARRRAGVRAVAHCVQVAGDPAGVDRAEPAIGGALRPDHHLPAGHLSPCWDSFSSAAS
jgi:hypothetical protein